MIKQSRGFTVVELTVVVVVIGLLMALIGMGVTQYQKVSRDAVRESAVTTVVEGLEKYYLANGEYPSVPALTAPDPASVAELIKVDAAALKMPSSTASVSIVPAGSTNADAMVYAGTNTGSSLDCQTAPSIGCDSFQLTYQKEVGGTITIQSRHEGGTYATTLLAPPKPTLTAESGGGVLVESQSSETACATDHTAKYSFRNKTGSNPWSSWSPWQTAATYAFSGEQGATYTLQVQTRCDRAATAGVASEPSDSISFTVPVNAPTAPTLTVVFSSNSVLATASVTTCPSGYTAQYALRSRTNNGTWGSYSAWSTTRTASQAAAQGVRYGYQVQARCYSAALTSGTSASPEVVYTQPFGPPTAPTVSLVGSGASTSFAINATTCPSGASVQYQYRTGDDMATKPDGSGPAGFQFYSWYGPYSSAPTSISYTKYSGYEYRLEAQARCTNAYSTGPWSISGSNGLIVPMTTPGGPTGFVSTLNAQKTEFKWTWTAPSCPAATIYNVMIYWHWNEGRPDEWHPAPIQGYYTGVARFTVQGGEPLSSGIKARASARYICINTHTGRTSAWGPEVSSPTYTIP